MAQNTQDLVKQIAALAESLAKLVHKDQKETSVDTPPQPPAADRWAHVNLNWRLEEAVKAVELCASSGALDVIKFLVDKFNLSAEEVRDKFSGAFQRAAGAGHTHVVNYLFDELKTENDMPYIQSTLQGAIKGGRLDVIKFVMEKYHVTIKDVVGCPCMSPFGSAISSGNLDVVKYFVETFNMTPENVSMEWVFMAACDASKRYNVEYKDGGTYFTFANPTPISVFPIMRRKCSWLTSQKQWRCVGDARTENIERRLTERGWKRGKIVNMNPIFDYFKEVFGRFPYSEEELAQQLNDSFGVKIGDTK